MCIKLVLPVSWPLHNLDDVFHYNNQKCNVYFFFTNNYCSLDQKKFPRVLPVANTCFLTLVITNVSLTPKKRACLTWLAKHVTMRDGEHICIMSTYGSFLHNACVFVLVCCKTLTFEAILVVDYVEGICFSENIAKMLRSSLYDLVSNTSTGR